MFRKRSQATPAQPAPAAPPTERITSVLSTGISWKGQLGGSGGVRIEGTFEGDIAVRGLLVVGETGRLTCQTLRANTVIIAGAVKGNITAQKVEIRATGRVWGGVVTTAIVTEEGGFLLDRTKLGSASADPKRALRPSALKEVRAPNNSMEPTRPAAAKRV